MWSMVRKAVKKKLVVELALAVLAVVIAALTEEKARMTK
jgi:hypothetical protein